MTFRSGHQKSPAKPITIALPSLSQESISSRVVSRNYAPTVNEDIPVGTGRTFTAKAYDSADRTHRIYGGSVTNVTISANTVADVIIPLNDLAYRAV